MNVTMRFGGISLSHNPKTLKITRSKKINSVGLVGGTVKLSNVCDNISKISGTGEIYGDDCFLSYDRLLRMCFKNKADILAVPELGAFKAVLEDIAILAEPRENFLSVSFTFRAVSAGREPEKILPEKYYTAAEGESLWDVSYKFGVTVESLVKLNPQIRKILDLKEGEEVRLY